MAGTLTRWQRIAFYRSRDPAWLWGSLIVILTLGFLAGLVTERLGRGAETSALIQEALSQSMPFDLGDAFILEPLQPLRDVFLDEPPEFPDALDMLAGFVPTIAPESRAEARSIVESATISEPTRSIALHTFDAHAADPIAAPAALVALAGGEPVTPHANFALGVIHASAERLDEAIAAFEREATLADAHEARRRVITLALATRDGERLARLADDPAYAEHLDAGMRLEGAIVQRDWVGILTQLVPSQVEQMSWRQLLLAGTAGLLWWLLLVQLAQPESLASSRVVLCATAFLLGVASVYVTLLLIILEEDVLGILQDRDDVVGGLVYMIAGVGLREELSKLLLFLPLVPILLRRGSQLEMILVAGCVGLGFAAEENINYFLGLGGMSTPGRYLTANFLHIAMTGLIGLAFCRIFLYRQQGLALFAQTFVSVVVLHGLYNAFISVPEFADFGLLANFFCLAALAFWFFRELRELRPARRDVVSPVATFVVGVSLMLAITLATLSFDLGVRASTILLAVTAAELALVAYLFLREMPGSMVTV